MSEIKKYIQELETELQRKQVEIEQLLDELHSIREGAWASEHVILESGIVPGIDYLCRCDQCRKIVIAMCKAGYLDDVKEQWWKNNEN